jgi:hypothetical protein
LDFELRIVRTPLTRGRVNFRTTLPNPQSEIRNQKFFSAPVAQLEECDASNVEAAGSSPARSAKHFRLPIANCRFGLLALVVVLDRQTLLGGSTPIGIRQLAIGNALSGSDVAGNIRVFQTRFESSNLSFRSKKSKDEG